MDKFETLKGIYDTTEDKEGFLSEFDEAIRGQVQACLEQGDAGLFEQLWSGTTLSEEGPVAQVTTTPAETVMEQLPSEENTSVDEVTLPEGDVTGEVLQDVITMNNEIQEAPVEEIEALPEEIAEGAQIWKDASREFSYLICKVTSDILRGTDFSEGDILVTGCKVAEDLEDAGYNKTSLSRATDEVYNELNQEALQDLYLTKEELLSLRDSIEDVVDYVSDKDNLGLTPSAKEELVDVILDDGIFTNDPEHDVREDVEEIISQSGDYSAMDASVRARLVNDLTGYEFSMENARPLTIEALSKAGNFSLALRATQDAIDFFRGRSRDFDEVGRISPASGGVDPNLEAKIRLINAQTEKAKAQQAVVREGRKKSGSDVFNDILAGHRERANSKLEIKNAAKAKAEREATINNALYTLGNVATPVANAVSNASINSGYKQAYNDMVANPYLAGATVYNQPQQKSGPSLSKLAVGTAAAALAGYGAYKIGSNMVDKKSDAKAKELTTKALEADAAKRQAEAEAKKKEAAAKRKKAAAKKAKAGDSSMIHYRAFSDEGEAVGEDPVANQILMTDEAVQSLAEKYASLPTIEAKNMMVQDMVEAGMDEEYISAITGRANGEFSEDEGEAMEVDPYAVADAVEQIGPEEIAQPDETVTTDELDGTLPAGVVQEEGTALEERIEGEPEYTPEAVVEGVDPETGAVPSDDSFEDII